MACSWRAANDDHDRFRRNRQARSANRDILYLRMEEDYEETEKTKERTGNALKLSYGGGTDAGSWYGKGIGGGDFANQA